MGIVEPLTPATFADDAALAEIHFGEASGHDVETIDGLLEKGSWFNTWPQNLRDTYLVGTEQRLYREQPLLHQCRICQRIDNNRAKANAKPQQQ